VVESHPGPQGLEIRDVRRDVERFAAAAGDLLDELGYPRGASHPNPEASRMASLVRASFAQELLAVGDRPPGFWKT
jgi:hypothetical protein